jgi:co-chaperonin GroES (HSP10)
MSDEQAIDVSRIKPINSFLLVRKCERKDEGLIILPDAVKETTNYCEVLAVGPKCKQFTGAAIGKMIICPDFADGLHCIDEAGEYWMVKESLIEPVVYS